MKKTIVNIAPAVAETPRTKRVAAYARVSCGKDTMLHSLAAQIDYYRDYIMMNPECRFAGVYADEAKTGTKDNREQFQLLLTECRNGNVDMIITKSISRLARNTVTLLETVRELKSLGVDVFFEEQNIYTLSVEGEVMLTLLASFAQTESLSCSDNCKWRIRKGFEEGRASTCTMLGYRLVNGEITLIEEEAEIAKRIFDLYLAGYGLQKIANTLNEEGMYSIFGNEWHPTTVRKVLTNEKYCGDLLLQKVYCENHLTKKMESFHNILLKTITRLWSAEKPSPQSRRSLNAERKKKHRLSVRQASLQEKSDAHAVGRITAGKRHHTISSGAVRPTIQKERITARNQRSSRRKR